MPLPLEELGSTHRERALLRRVGLAIALVVAGAVGGVSSYSWAATRIGAVDAKITGHLREMEMLRPRMDAYVREERSARCSIARNVYRLCLKTGEACEPVSASCE